MMQIVENHAEIVGHLLKVDADPSRPGFVTLHVAVESAIDLNGVPNFFKGDIGTTIALTARRGGTAAERPLGPVRLRARKTGPGLSFAEDEVP